MLLDADAGEVDALRANLPADSILEPVVRRGLHMKVPIELRPSTPRALNVNVAAPAREEATPEEVWKAIYWTRSDGVGAAAYRVTVTGAGVPLKNIDVLLYFRDSGGSLTAQTVTTDSNGQLSVRVPAGCHVAFVQPMPYASFWVMLGEAPRSGSTVDCPPIAQPEAGNRGWWHEAQRIDVSKPKRGAGIRVGVIDTGCGPHQNLSHVTLVGAFVDGTILPPDQATDVAEHGTHTTGIIGSRPTKASDYVGMAPGCDLFHARVFKGDGPEDGPTQADIVNAIDGLSRDHQCDLINMSLGGSPPSEAEEDAIRDAAERGTLCICSAGNKNGPIEFPAAYSECAAVSAIGKVGWAPAGTVSANNRPREAAKMGQDNLFLAAFSCFGPTLACAGPGVGIVSTVPDRDGFVGAYMEKDGTSMASPAVCGTLAVILSQDPSYKNLPRDSSRSKRAALILAQHCVPFGLPIQFEGRGLPKV